MKIIEVTIDNQLDFPKNVNICLGYFDSLHIGHQFLVENAKEDGYKVGLLTFEIEHDVFLPHKDSSASICSLYDKFDLLSKFGVDYLYALKFSNDMKNLTAEEFLTKIISKLSPHRLVVGEDFRFGKNGLGNVDSLKMYYPTIVISNLKENNEKVSTKKIINLIKNGQIQQANHLLGRYYQITGLVVEGLHNGSKIGFPTCNLKLSYQYVLPKIGVYIGRTYINGYGYYGIVSVSTHPTIMELSDPIIEINIYDFFANLYGKEISVEFIEYINDIEKFESLEKLKERLNEYKEYLVTKYL